MRDLHPIEDLPRLVSRSLAEGCVPLGKAFLSKAQQAVHDLKGFHYVVSVCL